MKSPIHSFHLLKWPLALVGSLALGSPAAFANRTEKFAAADADSSGSLTLAEFGNALGGHPKEKQVIKKFHRADSDNDGLVTLEEWLAFKQAGEIENENEEENTARFEAADDDRSGSLTLAEFTTTVGHGHPPEEVILKKFTRADANDDDLVSLQEFLAYKQDHQEDEIEDDIEHDVNRFNGADTDDDGFLTYDEFKPTVPGKRPEIRVRERFLLADANNDDLVSLEEWLAFKNDEDETDDETFRKFDLADTDANDELTLDEFADVFPPGMLMETVIKKFNNKDDNEDGVLTRDEWNPGGGDGNDDDDNEDA